MVNERPEMLAKSATLYFGPWYRQSPFFKATLRAGCTAYDIYNHMYLPGYFDDPDTEYDLLSTGVTMWDVGVERTVQVAGPDADRLIDMLTCRDLSKCAVKQGKYMIVTSPDGGIVNDPVLLHVAEDNWWMQLADSDAGLYAMGVAATSGLDADVTFPDVHPMQVQGPLSAKTLEKLVGPAIYDIKYYWVDEFEINGIPVLISRTGWTAIPGFEVNLLDGSKGDELWSAVTEAGEEFGIKPIAPREARRIEAGIFNYGSDFRVTSDTPFHVTGLEKYVELEQPGDFIGKEALSRIAEEGVDRKLVGVEIGGPPMTDEGALNDFWPVVDPDGRPIGRITAGAWSPRLEKNIGYAWVPATHVEEGIAVEIRSSPGPRPATVAGLPFYDPAKRVPVG
jgi:glycine cleavage system aminomethyltransferase T